MTKKTTVKLPRSVRRMFPNVNLVMDATKAVEISVNRRDCKIAEKLNPTECALAKAAKRELKVDGVIIGMGTSYLIKDNKAIRFNTPQSVKREIISFDRHKDFAPGDYYLLPKSEGQRLGASNNNKNKIGGKYKSARRKIHMSARVRLIPKGIE